MDEISKILKEAKPLYIQRKKRKKGLKKTALSLFMIISIIASGYSGYTIKSLSSSEYIAGIESYMTDSFLPVDSYGLVTVEY